jgi:AcrR family transcriptional regulator
MSVRAEQAAQTRERILDAALACYREAGISATSLQAVARSAHVSAATVLNHFGSADELARVVIDRLAATLHIPDDSEWPERGRPARVQRLVCEMFEFYERSRPWFDIFRADLDVDPALREGEAGFWQAIGELYGRVFAGALEDDRVRGAVFGLTAPSAFVARMLRN